MKKLSLFVILLLCGTCFINAQKKTPAGIASAIERASGKVANNHKPKEAVVSGHTPALTEKEIKAKAASGTAEGLLEAGKYYMDLLKFSTAEPYLTKAVRTAQARKQNWRDIQKVLEACRLGEQMLSGTEKITVIDSIVVDKKEFLSAYKLSEATGSLDYFSKFFGKDLAEQSTVYKTEFGDKIYYAQPDSANHLRLYTSDNMNGQWSKGMPLQGIGGLYTEENYPFMCGDGTTLYFASKGIESIGGYDLFVTRAGEDNTHYLKADNMGMPYNSPANDYMLVLDEYNNLGWFASDRFQPEDKVCIYVYIPNKSRVTFDPAKTDSETLRHAAALFSIKDTQVNPTIVQEGLARLATAGTQKKHIRKSHDFTLVINDDHTYTAYSDFKSASAKAICTEWVKSRKQYDNEAKALEKLRNQYAAASDDVKQQLAGSILQLEKSVEILYQQLQNTEIQIRNTEIQALNSQN